MKGLVLLGLLFELMLFSNAHAQLISPGKLSRPHATLEGVRNCTNCHVLRTRGITNSKCLDCHTSLQKRIQANTGFHADLADQNCATCHKDHFGRSFESVRFDTIMFDHAAVGFELLASHDDIGCRDCHGAVLIQDPDVRAFKGEHGALNRTYLGLGSTCIACHSSDDVHLTQFASRGCEQCHEETAWETVERFDHNASRYRLTGRHRDVECGDCHRTVRTPARQGYVQYVDIPFANCTACHDDVHAGDMEESCTDCHTTSGWHTIRRASAFERGFDHAKTEFPLVGKHADADCGSCHGAPLPDPAQLRITFSAQTRGNTYPHPLVTDCTSCHTDYHQDVFSETPGGVTCENCHTEHGWVPGTYDIDRHNREATFALTGAHLTAPCNLCHTPVGKGTETQLVAFRFDNQDCFTCHELDDPHQSQFAGVPCEDCHDTQSFAIAPYDHSETRFPLDGEHRGVPCESCHPVEQASTGSTFVRYKPLEMKCNDCHGDG